MLFTILSTFSPISIAESQRNTQHMILLLLTVRAKVFLCMFTDRDLMSHIACKHWLAFKIPERSSACTLNTSFGQKDLDSWNGSLLLAINGKRVFSISTMLLGVLG